MADCQEPCEESEVPEGPCDVSGEGHRWHQSPAEGPGNEGSGSCPRERLEEDQTGALWDKEEEEEEEGEEEEADTSESTGDEEEVDPRVAENLEILNQSCAEVNRLENELDEARSKYRSTFQTSSQRMEELGGKIRKSIQRARHYFELTETAKQAQNEALRAARHFQTANGNYRAAMEMAMLAEKGLEDTSTRTRTLTSAWQETLSHAVERVTEAEREKTRCEAEHNKKAAICAQLENQIHRLEKKYKRSIAKARPYFETKAELELKLQQLKQNVWDLQHAIGIRKTRYAEALRCLEAVSTEIHESRRSRKKLMLQFPREPGVGAETDSLGSSISDANIERGVFSSSAVFPDEEEDEEDSDDAGDVFSSDTSSGRQKASTRSPSKRCTHKQLAAEDSGSACSHTSGSVFSRSVSGASVFSSEGQSDSAPESPCSSSAMSAASSSSAAERVPTSPAGTAPSLVELARGDVGCRRKTDCGEGPDPEAAAGDRWGSGAHPTGTRTPVSGQDPTQDARDLPHLPFSPSPGCQREAGDGSAQEDCPREADSSSPLPPNSQPSLCSQFSSVLTSSPHQRVAEVSQSQERPLKAAEAQLDGAGVKTVGMTTVTSPPQAVSGEVKKTPLRRTDVASHRPLQGVMLLNPSDLAASSFSFVPRI